MFAPSATETAVANGDTRTIYLHHAHRNESIAATYRVNGRYDPAVLEKLNYFLRDWRNDDQINMDPRLFDVVWEVYRTAGANDEIQVLSAYRSPETNAMLRRRSRAVAEHSQHMLGKAMDTTMPDMSMEKLREIGMRMQRGGVGYYPNENFVHLDVGSVRHWPRMNYDQLVRLFPDGKTVHIPSNGQPLARYEEARAEIEANGGMAPDYEQPQSKGFFAWLFGGGSEDESEEVAVATSARPSRARVARGAPPQVQTATAAFVASANPPASPTLAERYGVGRNTPEGPAPAIQPEASQPAAVQQVASLAQTPPMPPVRKQIDSDISASDSDVPASGNTLPIPPRRPSELMTLAPVPLPPSRPTPAVTFASLAQNDLTASIPTALQTSQQPPSKPDMIAALISAPQPAATVPAKTETASLDTQRTEAAKLARPELPAVITQGPDRVKSFPADVLAYAASPPAPALTAPLPGLRSAALVKTSNPNSRTQSNSRRDFIVSARLDGSNFRGLTSDFAAAQMTTQSVLGQSVYGLRAAAHIEPGTLSNSLSANYVARFASAATDLDTAHFTGAAVQPLPSAAEALRQVASFAR
jgi:uncharacterized protein YcbK (DUF882 family)